MNAKSSQEQLNQLFEAFFQELQDMPDQEVLTAEPVSAIRNRALTRIERAAGEAGRRRMAAARTAAASVVSSTIRREVSVHDALTYIKRVVNDPHYTLAARKLDEMSEEEVFLLYEQIRALEANDPPTGP